MYYFGYLCLVVGMLCSFGAALLSALAIWTGKLSPVFFTEKAHFGTTVSLLGASAALLHALFWQDYSLQYVASYTDKYLSLFYRMTAFWAGQPGSLLFWALAAAFCATVFAGTPAYDRLSGETRHWFWLFQHTILVFFLLLLTCYSNPFVMQTPVPADGNGLNPLLQNPGMIIHPPLLFIGYAGFIVPTCLALAGSLTRRLPSPIGWFVEARSFLLVSWLFLTAGIMLGAWWAYMELGWGGYWAWDPVENSSLVPWLLATALLHTVLIEKRLKNFSRFNVFLVCLTTISTFFATYLVRSGVIDSVHAFGRGTVGTPLLISIVLFLLVAAVVAFTRKTDGESVPAVWSREAFLSFMSWFLITLAVIITTATVWPVLTSLFSSTRGGLDASFYNRVCLPLAAVLLVVLAFCPWAARKNRVIPLVLLAVFLLVCGLLWYFGYRNAVAMVATASAAVILLGLVIHIVRVVRKREKSAYAALGAHLGIAFCALGIAFSGAYSTEKDILFTEGESAEVDDYIITLNRVAESSQPGFAALSATLSVETDDRFVGTLVPERRIYEKFGDMQFSEVDTIFSFGNELYASLLGLTAEKKVLVRFSVKPLVNWLWLGGLCMSLLPLLCFLRKNRADTAQSTEE